MLLLLLILFPIIIGLLQYIFKTKYRADIVIIAQIITLAVTLTLFSSHETYQLSLSNASLPFGMVLHIDQLTRIFLLLNNILFLFATLFNSGRATMKPLFLFLFLGLQGLINGIFLSYDLFNTYILIEVSTVTVSILIMFKRDSRSMYDGMIYLLVNMFAMTFYLMGIGFLYRQFGTLDYYTLKQAIDNTSTLNILMLPYAFIMTGVSLKAALMPLFSWLPKAHGTPSAPSIVSAVLSGIYVKTGIYLIMRMQILFEPLHTETLFISMGFITAFLGIIFAIAQTDVKLILAYSTISQVGLILIGISSSDPYQYYGGLYHIFNHGLFKAMLFFMAGILIEHYGTRDITKMKGLWHHSKLLSIFILIAGLSITGAPFFNGGYSKYYIAYDRNPSWLLHLITLGTLSYFMKFVAVIFSKPADHIISDDAVRKVIQTNHFKKNDLGSRTYIALGILSLICLILGIGGDFITPILLGFNGHLGFVAQIEKAPLYSVLLIVSFIIYRMNLHNSIAIKAFRAVDLGFNAICGTVVIFFFGLLVLLDQIIA